VLIRADNTLLYIAAQAFGFSYSFQKLAHQFIPLVLQEFMSATRGYQPLFQAGKFHTCRINGQNGHLSSHLIVFVEERLANAL
jgi:hypothetical protein